MFKANSVFLRVVEPHDAPLLLLWENNPQHWKVTDTEVPFSMQAILQLIDQQQQIRMTGQLRMMICLNETEEAVGAIDLYDVDFKNKNAAIGILIGDAINKKKGYAAESLVLMQEYAKNSLELYNLYCSIQADNEASIHLFEKIGFEKIGTRKEWFLIKGQRVDEILYQLCLKK
jgi:diamine N-acetyltransferase